jgi:hypothetical protein
VFLLTDDNPKNCGEPWNNVARLAIANSELWEEGPWALSERRLRGVFGAAFCFLRSSMSALGQKQIYAVQKSMSALPPIATANADSRKRSCPLYPRKRHADIAPAYSITSSARPMSVLGTVMPSALAVLRLMYISTFVACWTGKSASPRKN